MRTATIIGLAAAAVAAYALFKPSERSGIFPDTSGPVILDASGKLAPYVPTTVPAALAMAQKAVQEGGRIQTPAATLVPQNTTFKDTAGNLFRTGANQTVSRLATGQVKVLTVTPVAAGTSFFDRPIRTINGKRTRVY